MSREVRIDAPGAGKWIMDRSGGGRFVEGFEHSFSLHEDGEIVGGVVVGNYFGNSMMLHVASLMPRYYPKELLWLVHHYVFVQCGCHKLIGMIKSTNHRLLTIGLRNGWQLEATIKDVWEPGVHGVILTLLKENCPWLNYKPKIWKPGSPTRMGDVQSIAAAGP
jgi:hypothetical protein